MGTRVQQEGFIKSEGKKMPNRYRAYELADKYGVQVKQARYRKDGKWYHHLKQFPAAFFDEKGYIRFETSAEYERCPQLQLKNDVHVAGGMSITSIPGYVQFTQPLKNLN